MSTHKGKVTCLVRENSGRTMSSRRISDTPERVPMVMFTERSVDRGIMPG